MEKEVMMIVAMLIVLGIYLLVAYSRISAAAVAQNEPADSRLMKANQGLFTMAIVFMVSGIAFGLCHHNCQNKTELKGNHYMAFFLLLGVCLISLASVIIHAGAGAGKSWAVSVLLLGIVFILVCGGLFYKKHGHSLLDKLKARHAAMKAKAATAAPTPATEGSMAFSCY